MKLSKNDKIVHEKAVTQRRMCKSLYHIWNNNMRTNTFILKNHCCMSHNVINSKWTALTDITHQLLHLQDSKPIKPLSSWTSIYRVSQEESTKLREGVHYVKIYRYNSKHIYPKLNSYGDNGHRKVWASGGSTYCTPSVTPYLSTAHA
jgi:hypothetical protein